MQSVRALTDGLVDYAGLFPPAGLDMGSAVQNYAEYIVGEDARMLGRFVLPAARLLEFAELARPLLPKRDQSRAWKLSTLLGEDPEPEIQKILKFNCEHWAGSELGHAVIDSVELKISDPNKIKELKAVLPDFYRAFVEVPAGQIDGILLDTILASGFSAKIRMGGVEQGAFPTTSAVVGFLEACLNRHLPFKATAGLHHIVCGSYPLTYEQSAQKGDMFGFLNVFLAAAYLFNGGSARDAEFLLSEKDVGAFEFRDEDISWRGNLLSATQIANARKEFAVSFGSCSFTEPVAELKSVTESQRKA